MVGDQEAVAEEAQPSRAAHHVWAARVCLARVPREDEPKLLLHAFEARHILRRLRQRHGSCCAVLQSRGGRTAACCSNLSPTASSAVAALSSAACAPAAGSATAVSVVLAVAAAVATAVAAVVRRWHAVEEPPRRPISWRLHAFRARAPALSPRSTARSLTPQTSTWHSGPVDGHVGCSGAQRFTVASACVHCGGRSWRRLVPQAVQSGGDEAGE